jgi:aspartyl-tRNA(Asn)/glutamyl-tRNA(Gln) amidotransferase subunit A
MTVDDGGRAEPQPPARRPLATPPGRGPRRCARVTAALDRIDPVLGAFIAVDSRVPVLAEEDRGGRLRGLILGVKDLFDTGSLPTTYGSARYAGQRPERDAVVVASLLHEGAVLLGKTNLNEYAYGVSGYNPYFGAMLTPADKSRTAGGSSGGSAVAVASGVCDVAIGTDTSGSVRIPAACCNVYGFKAATGAYPLTGVFPLAPSLDSVGFLAPGVAALARVLDVGTTPDAALLRVARLDHDVRLPPLPAAHWVLFRSEAYRVHEEALRTDPEGFGADLRLKLGGEIGDVAAARAGMSAWRAEVVAALRGFDILESEVFPGGPPTLEAVLRDYRNNTLIESERLMTHTPVANALGWPAMAVPTEDGPRHLLARPGDEPALLARAAAIGLKRSEIVAEPV